MTDLYLEPTQDGTGVRLYPANHSFFHNSNGLHWIVDIDAAVPVDVASMLFTAFHTMKHKTNISADKLCMYLNTFLTGKRLVIQDGCTIHRTGVSDAGIISTSRCVPVIHNNLVNVLGVESLLNSLGMMPKNAVIQSAHYDAGLYEYGAVHVYVDDMRLFVIECRVQ